VGKRGSAAPIERRLPPTPAGRDIDIAIGTS
jgi:hypothetical protein